MQRPAARNEMNLWPACVEHNRTHEQHHNRLLYMYTLRLYRGGEHATKEMDDADLRDKGVASFFEGSQGQRH